MVLAPEFGNDPVDEEDVLRLPAIQHFNGSDFSVVYPVPVFLSKEVADFEPDIVHSHHPFLLGDTALRISAMRNIPVVYTHHTMYEQYTHYVPGDSPLMQRFVIELATGYANLCSAVIAPSESIGQVIRERGVMVPVEVIPTGVDLGRFAKGDGVSFRRLLGIPLDALVVGYTGRLAPEKNLGFLSQAVAQFLQKDSRAHFLVVGSGPSDSDIREIFKNEGLLNRLHFAGSRTGTELVNAYHAMDVFAFASHSETQGLVLVEAMACGLPVVAVDAPGSREVVQDSCNGRLLRTDDLDEFCSALCWLAALSRKELREFGQSARETVGEYDTSVCMNRVLRLYQALVETKHVPAQKDDSALSAILRTIEEEWNLWANRVSAVAEAALGAMSANE